jgi:hypothetical protein
MVFIMILSEEYAGKQRKSSRGPILKRMGASEMDSYFKSVSTSLEGDDISKESRESKPSAEFESSASPDESYTFGSRTGLAAGHTASHADIDGEEPYYYEYITAIYRIPNYSNLFQ